MKNRLLFLTNELSVKYTEIVFTNINSKGVEVSNTIWLYDKNYKRSGNVITEIYDKHKPGKIDFVMQNYLLSNEEKAKSQKDKRTTLSRGFFSEYFENDLAFLNYLEEKLQKYYKTKDYKLLNGVIRTPVKIEEKVMFDKNMILYGPPGTGKTYNSVNYAVAIIEKKDVKEIQSEDYSEVLKRYRGYKQKGQIEFVTFHQSYGYEEFIEGIKPDVENDDLKYKIADGIFKDFCQREIYNDESHFDFDKEWDRMLEEIEENDNKLIVRLKRIERALEWEPTSECFVVHYQSVDVRFDKSFVKSVFDGTVERKANNGTFDTKESSSQGIIEYLKQNSGISFVNKNADDERKVFIIDEINRGNISKIFGELITLIEDTKREGMPEAMSAVLPYSGDSFCVPQNVYILGTMNTADRSIALMDTALRRRFTFIEMMPDLNLFDNIEIDGLNISEMLGKINERITYLYDREHTIGHAFFTPLLKEENRTINVLAAIFKNKIIPLLQEYFYDDYEKIQLVLGDNAKPDDLKFIKDEPLQSKNVFSGNIDDVVDLPEKKYLINKQAFEKIESYKQIRG